MNWKDLLWKPFDEYKELRATTKSYPYYELLCLEEWRDKRIDVFHKDHWKCVRCGKELQDLVRPEDKDKYTVAFYEFNRGDSRVSPPLEAHHTYYVWNKLPWEYPENSLITLCHSCHTEIHETTEIKVYKANLNEEVQDENSEMPFCKKCGGNKIFPEYRHVEGGVCFSCRGLGYVFYYRIG